MPTMRRRTFLELTLAGAAWALAPAPAAAHTPYRQWAVYRKRHLLILTSKTAVPTFALGKRVAAVLAARLPESQAAVSRAPHTERIASLISSKQMEVAILSPTDAENLLEGRAPFADYGPVALRTIVGLGDYLLICRDDFPALHAYLVAKTLVAGKADLPAPVTAGNGGKVPLHPGAEAFFQGRPPPPAPKDKAK